VNGREIPVTGAWVVVAPPNFAPGIQGVVTLYDLLFDVATRLEPTLSPRRPSFSRQIYPLFARMVQNQWVNAGFLRDFGWGSASNFLEPSVLARLTDPSPDYQFLRWQVFSRFRDPAYLSMEYNDLPPYYGDGVELPAANPRQWMAVLQTQHLWLRQWADGEFDADWPPGGVQFASQLEQIPLDEQPAALDRAALDECLGGPFHPGCEMTWPMRHASLYSSPFRLHRRIEPEPDWGEAMTSAIALAPDGPLSGSGPGDLTRWMAVPWQTDTSSCLSRYKVEVDDYLPTFWPARVPNDVLSWQSYQKVIDPSLSLEERQAAFVRRDKWLRPLPEIRAEAVARINAFLQEWDRAGVVTQSPGPTDDAPFPDQFWVERDHALTGLGAESPSLATPPAS
jgi:hypothetical protein